MKQMTRLNSAGRLVRRQINQMKIFNCSAMTR